MPTIPAFDTLGYFEKLTGVGFTEAQAKVQVAAMQDFVRQYDEASRKELSTKSDIQDLRLEIEKVKFSMLKWQLGIGLALVAIMAKGFGWLGF